MTCASTSSALCTTRVGSTSPSRIAWTIAGELHRVVEERRNEHPAAHGTERVPGASDALQSVRDSLRALELNHEIDRPDVDAQLQGARADERAQITGLEALLEQQASLARQRPVIRQRELLVRRAC